ncbi:MAG: tetratricopeptide repeat protein [Bacteroidota bacterium]
MVKTLLIRILMVSGVFLFIINSSFSQYNFNENCQLSYQAAISLQFVKARLLIEKEKTSNPQNLIPVYLENLIDCITLFITEDPALYRHFKEKKSRRLSLLEKGWDGSPYYRFCLAQVYLQWAFARLKFEDYAAAANELRLAYNLLKTNDEIFPDFLLNKTGLGIVHVTFGVIPENYRWISSILGLKGSMDQGIDEIRQIAMYSGADKLVLLYKPEAAFCLAFITLNLQQNKNEARTVLKILNCLDTNYIEHSPLLIYARASILMKTGLNDDALKVLQQRSELHDRFPFLYLDYLEGIARLNQLDFSASDYFETFLNSYKGHNYSMSALQKLSWIACLNGDTVQYRLLANRMRKKVVFQVDEDKQAVKETNAVDYPNRALLRSRLLFDGGYYFRALSELLDKPVNSIVKTKKDFIEYSYRLGRIYHESNKTEKAIEYYQNTIDRGKSLPYYFAAAAAMQMGLIYENQNEWGNAEAAYRLSLSIEAPEYKTSLRQKAKAGLDRVKKKVKT